MGLCVAKLRSPVVDDQQVQPRQLSLEMQKAPLIPGLHQLVGYDGGLGEDHGHSQMAGSREPATVRTQVHRAYLLQLQHGRCQLAWELRDDPQVMGPLVQLFSNGPDVAGGGQLAADHQHDAARH